MKLSKTMNRNTDDETDETFFQFLKKYRWIEFLVLSKTVIFINRGYYGYFFGASFLLGTLVVLWILYRIGLE